MNKNLFGIIFEIINYNYDKIVTVIAIILLIWGLYSKIKFLCLKKASEVIVDAESHYELSGKEKLALCIVWINNELPKLFRNSIIESLLTKLINFVYNNSFNYMKNYVKRKTGYDISELIEQIKENERDNDDVK